MFKAGKGHDYLEILLAAASSHIKTLQWQTEFKMSTNQPTACTGLQRDRKAQSEPCFVLCIRQPGPKKSNPRHNLSHSTHVMWLLPGPKGPCGNLTGLEESFLCLARLHLSSVGSPGRLQQNHFKETKSCFNRTTVDTFVRKGWHVTLKNEVKELCNSWKVQLTWLHVLWFPGVQVRLDGSKAMPQHSSDQTENSRAGSGEGSLPEALRTYSRAFPVGSYGGLLMRCAQELRAMFMIRHAKLILHVFCCLKRISFQVSKILWKKQKKNPTAHQSWKGQVSQDHVMNWEWGLLWYRSSHYLGTAEFWGAPLLALIDNHQIGYLNKNMTSVGTPQPYPKWVEVIFRCQQQLLPSGLCRGQSLQITSLWCHGVNVMLKRLV